MTGGGKVLCDHRQSRQSIPAPNRECALSTGCINRGNLSSNNAFSEGKLATARPSPTHGSAPAYECTISTFGNKWACIILCAEFRARRLKEVDLLSVAPPFGPREGLRCVSMRAIEGRGKTKRGRRCCCAPYGFAFRYRQHITAAPRR